MYGVDVTFVVIYVEMVSVALKSLDKESNSSLCSHANLLILFCVFQYQAKTLPQSVLPTSCVHERLALLSYLSSLILLRTKTNQSHSLFFAYALHYY